MNLLIYLDYICIKSKSKWGSVEHSEAPLKLSKEFWEYGYYHSNYSQHTRYEHEVVVIVNAELWKSITDVHKGISCLMLTEFFVLLSQHSKILMGFDS